MLVLLLFWLQMIITKPETGRKKGRGKKNRGEGGRESGKRKR